MENNLFGLIPFKIKPVTLTKKRVVPGGLYLVPAKGTTEKEMMEQMKGVWNKYAEIPFSHWEAKHPRPKDKLEERLWYRRFVETNFTWNGSKQGSAIIVVK